MPENAENNGTHPAAGKTVTANSLSTNVFALYGVEPEVQAYAMAKYSRSGLSMKESLKEISEQKAEQFLNTFYFQYGHRSIADLAHAAFAIERLSQIAAITLVDEQRWDGQERSTRYQNFKKSGFYLPDFGGNHQARQTYESAARFLFEQYEAFSGAILQHLRSKTPKPPEMEQATYDRTLKARAFDVSRYLLPLATNTSLGQILNSRTLETQISRLLSHSHAEIRQLGESLKRAAKEPAYNASHPSLKALIDEIAAANPELAERAAANLLKEVRVAPTLVKYATPNEYELKTRRELAQAAGELMKGLPVRPAKAVDLIESEPLEVELSTTLLYQACHYPYRQIREVVEALPAARRNEIIDLGLRHRGPHDELPRAFRSGQEFRFDILMDIGGFRDMHRHRRCTQIQQEFTSIHGYEIPEDLEAAGLLAGYRETMHKTQEAIHQIAQSGGAEAEQNSQYLIPMAYRKRTLFKMDLAEALYIAELRTTEAGHFSYRNVAYAMYEAVAEKHPSLAKYFRVTDVRQPVDLLKR